MRAPHSRTADARSLRLDALEQLRRRVVAAVESGIPQTQAAHLFGVSRKSVGSWVRAYRDGGESTLRPKPRGRRHGDFLALSAPQQSRILAAIAAGPPTEHAIPCLLWTRRAVSQLIRDEFATTLAGSTMDNYLSRWNLMPKGRKCPPGTARLTWTHPVVPGSPGRYHALVAVDHRGLLYFLSASRPFTPAALTGFVDRLRMQLTCDVRLQIHDWPVEHREPLSAWRDATSGTRAC